MSLSNLPHSNDNEERLRSLSSLVMSILPLCPDRVSKRLAICLIHLSAVHCIHNKWEYDWVTELLSIIKYYRFLRIHKSQLQRHLDAFKANPQYWSLIHEDRDRHTT